MFDQRIRTFMVAVALIALFVLSGCCLGPSETRDLEKNVSVTWTVSSVENPDEPREARRFQVLQMKSDVLSGVSATPRNLVSGDFDEDGTPDIVAAYELSSGAGAMLLSTGNVNLLWPNSPQALALKVAGRASDSPFLTSVQISSESAAPQFLQAADVDADHHLDLITASAGGNRLIWLKGDGRGNFHEQQAIEVGDGVTALFAGDLGRRDGLEEVAVVTSGSRGARLRLFSGIHGAFQSEPLSFDLPAGAQSLEAGYFNDDYFRDLAVAAGNRVVIFGGTRTVQLKEAGSIQFPSTIRSISAGNFSGRFPFEVSVLTEQGGIYEIHFSRKGKHGRWRTQKSARDEFPSASQLLRARITGNRADDLLVVDPSSQKIHILASRQGSRKREELQAIALSSAPVAVVPLRINVDALSDLVILQNSNVQPLSIAMTTPAATFFVFSTADTGDSNPGDGICNGSNGCTLRAAIEEANANPGPDLIQFGLEVPTPLVPATPYPQITDTVTIDGTTGPFPEFKVEVQGTQAAIGATAALQISAADCVIRGMVINRFQDPNAATLPHAIQVLTGDNQILEGNFIGTDITGIQSFPNNGSAIHITNSINDTIGGTAGTSPGGSCTGSCNLLSDSGGTAGGAGIWMNSPGGESANIQGNFVGPDVTGMAGIGNVTGIVLNNSNGNTIGGTTPAARNVISGNPNANLHLIAGSNNLVQGNYFGTVTDGTSGLGGGWGIRISNGSDNVIGGAQANVLAYAGNAGVELEATSTLNNQIRGNSIFSNATLGIDLASPDMNVTPNDPGDPDTGPNGLQNFPIITGVALTPGLIQIDGTLNSTPDTSGYTLDFYSNSTCDPLFYGEGETYLGSLSGVNTDSNGDAVFTTVLPFSNSGQFITATATDPQGNTSEFSFCFGQQAGYACTLTPAFATHAAGENHSMLLTLTNDGVPVENVPVDPKVDSGPNAGGPIHCQSNDCTTRSGGLLDLDFNSNGVDGVDTVVVSETPGFPAFQCQAQVDWVHSIYCAQPEIALTPGQFVSTSMDLSEITGIGVADVNVSLFANYDSLQSLETSLHSPDNIQSTLMNPTPLTASQIGTACGDNGDFLFDDGAGATLDSAATSNPVIGAFQPAEPLSSFNGSDPGGLWNLTLFGEGSGVLHCWCLTVRRSGPTCSIDPNGQTFYSPNWASLDIVVRDASGNPLTTVPLDISILSDTEGVDRLDIDFNHTDQFGTVELKYSRAQTSDDTVRVSGIAQERYFECSALVRWVNPCPPPQAPLRSYSHLLQNNLNEIGSILLADPELQHRVDESMIRLKPALNSLENGQSVRVSTHDLQTFHSLLLSISERGSAKLQKAIQKLLQDINSPDFLAESGIVIVE